MVWTEEKLKEYQDAKADINEFFKKFQAYVDRHGCSDEMLEILEDGMGSHLATMAILEMVMDGQLTLYRNEAGGIIFRSKAR